MRRSCLKTTELWSWEHPNTCAAESFRRKSEPGVKNLRHHWTTTYMYQPDFNSKLPSSSKFRM